MFVTYELLVPALFIFLHFIDFYFSNLKNKMIIWSFGSFSSDESVVD